MATAEDSGASAPRNTIRMIEPATVSVEPDYDSGGVALEVVDSAGNGFHTVLDQSTALDAAMRIIGALARLRGWVTP